MLLKESIRKVLKEETVKSRLISMIENDGLLHALKITNLNFSRLSSILGNDWITRKIQIKFIKDLMALRLYGFGLGEAGLDPIYYNENDLTAIRIGPWKSHMQQREGFFDYNKPSALIFNLRSDPFERHDQWKSREVAMKLGVAWGGQIQDVLRAHFASLQQFPPRQKSGTLRMGE